VDPIGSDRSDFDVASQSCGLGQLRTGGWNGQHLAEDHEGELSVPGVGNDRIEPWHTDRRQLDRDKHEARR
jgi:hypothetical protein